MPIEEIAVRSESPDAQVSRKLLQSEVRHAIDMLQESHREVILLRDIEGLSYAEIACILGCPPGTVMSRLARARQSLRSILCAPAAAKREVRR
jgi:RNA polymerase sigma-70 factor (ECF subfamily)